MKRRASAAPHESTIGIDGRTTVPASLRVRLALAPGTQIVWQVLPTGAAHVRVEDASPARDGADRRRRAG